MGKPLSSANWKAPTSTKGYVKSLMVNRRGRMYSWPVEVTSTRLSSWRNVQYRTLLGYQHWGFPSFSSVLRQMLGYKWKGHGPPTSYQRPSAEMIPPKCRSGLQPMRSQFWAQLPGYPTKERIASWVRLPPEANPPVLTCLGFQPRHYTR
jgi:hypothetical protein